MGSPLFLSIEGKGILSFRLKLKTERPPNLDGISLETPVHWKAEEFEHRVPRNQAAHYAFSEFVSSIFDETVRLMNTCPVFR